MNEIQKIEFIIWLVQRLFKKDKILAIASIRKLYGCTLTEARNVAELIGYDKSFN